MCVYVYTRLLTNCESFHASAIVAADWNPHHVPRRSHLPSSRLPTTWILRNIYGIYKMEDNKQTLDPRHRGSFSVGKTETWLWMIVISCLSILGHSYLCQRSIYFCTEFQFYQQRYMNKLND